MRENKLAETPLLFRSIGGNYQTETLQSLGNIKSSVIPLAKVVEITERDIESVDVNLSGGGTYSLIKIKHDLGKIVPFFIRWKADKTSSTWQSLPLNINYYYLGISGSIDWEYIQLIEYTDTYLLYDFYNYSIPQVMQIFFLDM